MLKYYTIEKELGKGTYGVVFKAKKKSDNNIYVIKQISLLGLSKSQKDEVKLESEILKKIKSKYVVKYYDSFEEDNNLYIVMEYCESGDLNDFIEKQKQTKHLLKENIIWNIFIKITLGLADIHKLKILHRDLKSLNIFLKQDNDVRVGDLGVAKVLNQTFFAKTFIGTPYYLSPEICEDKPYNDKSDVWALGCILYELCTYQHPFVARSQGGLILKILNENPKPINDCYSKELKTIISIIFDKDYQKRPSCVDILKMNFVIEKAKNLGIFADIKNSFPDIENSTVTEKKKIDKFNNKISGVHIKPIIVSNSKNNINNNNNNNNNNKKRPASHYGVFGRAASNKYNNIKFNNINPGIKKKNDNLGGLNIPKKKNNIFVKKIKIISSKDKINNKNNNNKIRKKVVVSQKDQKKAQQNIFLLAEKFEKNSNKNKIFNNNILNNKNNPILIKPDNNNNWINTKDLNKICNSNNDSSSITKDQSNIVNSKINDSTNNINNNNDNVQKGTINPKMNYSIDSKAGNENDNKNISIKKDDFEKTKDNMDNNNCSIESDIYMTAKRDIYQPKNNQKEDIKEHNLEITKKEEEKKLENNNNINNLGIEGSLPPMNTLEFKDLVSDFDTKKDATINDFKIINNNNEENKKNDFDIIDNNNEENKNKDEKGKNIDNNKSMSSEEEKDDNKYFSDNDKSNNESENENEEEEKVTEIDEKNINVDENIDMDNIEEEKTNIKNDLISMKTKIDYLKQELPKFIGEEKYKYIMEICSIGIKDDTKQKEVNDKIEQFIKENKKTDNEEKLYDIMQLFILECQYFKKQEKLNRLN